MPSRCVLLVEDRAHWPAGHFRVRVAELARGYAELGFDVDVLTARGWIDAGSEPVPFALSRYGRGALVLQAVASRLMRRRDHAAGDLMSYAGRTLRAFVGVVQARRFRRRAPCHDPLVVLLNLENDPLVAAIVAGPGRWLLNQFALPPQPVPALVSSLEGALLRVASHREARRHRGGGVMLVAGPSEQSAREWAARVPCVATTVLPVAGVRERAPVMDARAELGIGPDAKVALWFGTTHDAKDSATVWRAFSMLPDWQLVIAGQLGREYDDARPPTGAGAPTMLRERVDDATRARLYSAADVVVLSFRPGYARNSGTLADAISWGVPVVCSDRSAASETVEQYQLGITFRAGDPDALAAAVRHAPAKIEPEALERARREMSNVEIARRQLDAVRAASGV